MCAHEMSVVGSGAGLQVERHCRRLIESNANQKDDMILGLYCQKEEASKSIYLLALITDWNSKHIVLRKLGRAIETLMSYQGYHSCG